MVKIYCFGVFKYFVVYFILTRFKMGKKLWMCALILFISIVTRSNGEISEIADTETNDLEEQDLARQETTTETAELETTVETTSTVLTKKSNSTGGGSVFSNFLNSAANVAGAQVGLQLASQALGRPPVIAPGFPAGGYPQGNAPYSPYNNYNPQFSPYAYNPYQNTGGYNGYQGSTLGSYPNSYYPGSAGGFGSNQGFFGSPYNSPYNSGFGNGNGYPSSNIGYSSSQLGSTFNTFQRTDLNDLQEAKAANPNRGSSNGNSFIGPALAAGAGLALLGAFNRPSNYYPNSGGYYQPNYSPNYGGYNSPQQFGYGYRPHHHQSYNSYYRTVEQPFDKIITNQENLLYTDPNNYLRDGELPSEDLQPEDQKAAQNLTSVPANNIATILVPVFVSTASTYYPYQGYPYIADYTPAGKLDTASVPEGDEPVENNPENENLSSRRQSGSQIAGQLLGATAGYVLASSLLGGANNGDYYNQQPYYSGYNPSYNGGSSYNSFNSYRPHSSYNSFGSDDFFRNLPATENRETKPIEIIDVGTNQIEVARLDNIDAIDNNVSNNIDNNIPANQEINAQIIVSEASN